MVDHEILKSLAEQMMGGTKVVVEGRSSKVTRTGALRLRTVRFVMGGKSIRRLSCEL